MLNHGSVRAGAAYPSTLSLLSRDTPTERSTSRAVHLRGRVHRRMLHSAVVYTNEWTSACLCIAVPMDTHTHVRVTKPVRVGGARGAQ